MKNLRIVEITRPRFYSGVIFLQNFKARDYQLAYSLDIDVKVKLLYGVTQLHFCEEPI